MPLEPARNQRTHLPKHSTVGTERAVRGASPGQRVCCRWAGSQRSAFSNSSIFLLYSCPFVLFVGPFFLFFALFATQGRLRPGVKTLLSPARGLAQDAKDAKGKIFIREGTLSTAKGGIRRIPFSPSREKNLAGQGVRGCSGEKMENSLHLCLFNS